MIYIYIYIATTLNSIPNNLPRRGEYIMLLRFPIMCTVIGDSTRILTP